MKPIVLVALALLTACGRDRPPAPTAEQNEQLNEVEAMLDAMDNEEGPEDRSPGPSSSD